MSVTGRVLSFGCRLGRLLASLHRSSALRQKLRKNALNSTEESIDTHSYIPKPFPGLVPIASSSFFVHTGLDQAWLISSDTGRMCVGTTFFVEINATKLGRNRKEIGDSISVVLSVLAARVVN